MKTFITKSYDPVISDEEFENINGITSVISFERAIEESLKHNNSNKSIKDIKGYKITEYGIQIIWKT